MPTSTNVVRGETYEMNEWLIITLDACLRIPTTRKDRWPSQEWMNETTDQRVMLVIQRSVNGISNQERERQATKTIALGYCHVWTRVSPNIGVYVYTYTNTRINTPRHCELTRSLLCSMFKFAFDRIRNRNSTCIESTSVMQWLNEQ